MPKDIYDNMLDDEDQYDTPIVDNEEPGVGDPQADDDGVQDEQATPEPQPEPEGEPDPEPEVQEPEPVVNPYDEQFQQLGLNNQYRDVGDMMQRVPELQKWATRLSQEVAELKKQPEQPKQQYDPEQFYENPDTYLKEKYATKEEIQQMQQQMLARQELDRALSDFRGSHADFNDLEPTMVEIARSNPALLHTSRPHEILYTLAKARKAPEVAQAVQATTDKINAGVNSQKAVANANTSVRKPKPANAPTQADLNKMSLKQLEDQIGYGPGEEDDGF